MTPQHIADHVKTYYGISDLTAKTRRHPYPFARASAIVLMWEAGVHVPAMIEVVGLKRERIYSKYYASVDELTMCPKSKFSLDFAAMKKSINFAEQNELTMPKRNNEEHRLQCAIVNYLRMNNFFVFAIPNGGNRDARTGKMLKDEGALAGAADLLLMMHGRVIYIEVKTGKGTQQKSQRNFQAAAEWYGHEYMIWRSVDDAIAFVRDHMEAKRLNWGNYIANN